MATYETEIRGGQTVVVIPESEFNNFKKKRVSQKQRILEENDIDIKYLKQVQYRKKEGTYTFRITNIPNIDELKKLVSIQETYSVPENTD